MAMKIPRCMSTQHPDNVTTPFFSNDAVIGGEDEITEAYHAFAHLGCDEQMWDCEGKEVDDFVVKKLLTKYEHFFKEHKIGEDVFITLRVPNPAIEKAEAKVLLETLESIPRSYDIANMFYGEDIAPIFEVILPMTTSHKALDRIYRYYADYIVGRQSKSFGDITIAEWIGKFKPDKINVIPLVEDMDHMLGVNDIVGKYMEGKDLEYQRVFLARSDPAMNYGLVSAVLMNKIALQRLEKLSEESGVRIYPIIGMGSAPFRGNFTPWTIEQTIEEYPSAYTFTIQSAYKYDYQPDEVRDSIKKLQGTNPKRADKVDEERCLEIIAKYSKRYREEVRKLAPIINEIAKYVPQRRKRKLHIGLFGYSRDLEEGIHLPRVITFTAALYSIGLPPELLGLDALDADDLEFIRKVYSKFDLDIGNALSCFNEKSAKMGSLSIPDVDFEVNAPHKQITDHIIKRLEGKNTNGLEEYITRAASIRRFLG